MAYSSNVQKPGLSSHDQQVLNQIFGPSMERAASGSLSTTELNTDKPTDSAENITTDTAAAAAGDDRLTDSEASTKAWKLELEGIRAAGRGDLELAERLLTDAIKEAPNRAATFNNRAQVRRLANNITGAVADIETALSLSGSSGSAACQAFTQRAVIRRLQGDEVGASEDFKMAASLGGEFAQSQLVALNPFASLSGATVAEMLANGGE